MHKLPKHHAANGLPPHVSEQVLEYLENSPDAPNTERAWITIGTEQGSLVRHAIKEADKLRVQNADPGDAFLAGVRLAYSAIGEQMQREEFLKQMLAGPAAAEQ